MVLVPDLREERNSKFSLRVVIDMQGAQSSGSRMRGIGRYTRMLTSALLRNFPDIEFVLFLNGAFRESAYELTTLFQGDNVKFHVWHPFVPAASNNPSAEGNLLSSEVARELAIDELRPDFVLLTSLFEGFGDDIVTSIGLTNTHAPNFVILYDLIPHLFSKVYLTDHGVMRWYSRKIDHLRRADGILAISNASATDALQHLHVLPSVVRAISSDVDSSFKATVRDDTRERLSKRYGIDKKFFMYTGGIDFRKNIEFLVEAFSLIPSEQRSALQLAIVCSITPDQRQALEATAAGCGLTLKEVRITGYIPEEDLRELYSCCELFVFPSWYEGFGLPVLEAMRCGAPVIGSNRSSIPEIIEREDSLFDPFDTEGLRDLLVRAIEDQAWLAELREHAGRQQRKFSWDASARRLIEALKAHGAVRQSYDPNKGPALARPRLAYVSPLPPAQSGISHYSHELLPYLSTHYDIDLICDETNPPSDLLGIARLRSVDWFREHGAQEFEHVIYQMGNSAFHSHMIELIRAVPGVLVLHDFFLSGLYRHIDLTGRPGFWPSALYKSYGMPAAKAWAAITSLADEEALVAEFPCNEDVVSAAKAVIVHSKYSEELFAKGVGESTDTPVTRVPHARVIKNLPQRSETRRAKGFGEDDFVVCSFGFVADTKLSHRLIEGWRNSALASDRRCHLFLVGECGDPAYRKRLDQLIARLPRGERVRITGYVSGDQYDEYLAIADAGVQVRANSRGETSGAVLDCLAAGIPLIVNRNGSMGEYPDDIIISLPDTFAVEELADALNQLHSDKAKREAMSAASVKYIEEHHSPRRVAEQYKHVLESATQRPGLSNATREGIRDLGERYAALEADFAKPLGKAKTAFANRGIDGRLLIDTAQISTTAPLRGREEATEFLTSLLELPGNVARVEFVQEQDDTYRYARQFLYDFYLKARSRDFDEPALDLALGDIYVLRCSEPFAFDIERLSWFRDRGVPIVVYFPDLREEPSRTPTELLTKRFTAIEFLAGLDAVILCDSDEMAARASAMLEEVGPAFEKLPAVITAGAGKSIADLLGQLASDRTRHLFEPKKRTVWRFSAGNPLLRLGAGKLNGRGIENEGREGHITFGPYMHLKKGGYVVELDVDYASKSGWLVEGVHDQGNEYIFVNRQERMRRGGKLKFDFELSKPVGDFEFRPCANRRNTIKIRGFAIRRVAE